MKTCHCGASMNPTIRMQSTSFHECPACGALKRMKQTCDYGGTMWGARQVVLNLGKLGIQYFDGIQATISMWEKIR